MIRMTHLIWRNGRAYFRYRLPPQMRALEKSAHWPGNLKEFVSEINPEKLKHELSKALRTRDERLAKRRAAELVGWAEDLVEQGLAFIDKGPRAALSEAEIKVLAERYGASLIRSDLELRQKGIGLRLPHPADDLIQALGGRVPEVIDNSEPGLTEDDLGLLRFVAERVLKETKEAMGISYVVEGKGRRSKSYLVKPD